MKKLGLLIGLASMTATSFAQVKSSNYGQLAGTTTFSKDTIGSTLYLNNNLSLSEKSSLLTELHTGLVKDGALAVSHTFFRVSYNQKGVAEFMGWKAAMKTRYTPPTTTKAQQAGTLGSILLEPSISTGSDALSVKLKQGLGIFLNRNRRSLNVKNGGNSLVAFVSTAELGSNALGIPLSFGLVHQTILTADPADPQNNSLWTGNGEATLGTSYTVAGMDLGLSLGHSSSWGGGKKFSLFSKAAEIELTVGKAF